MKKQKPRRWSDQQIIDAFHRWAAEHEGRPPTFKQWSAAGPWWPSAFTVFSRFGSWSQALEMLGFEPHPVRRSDRLTSMERRRKEGMRLRNKGLSTLQIARELGCAPNTVLRTIGPAPKPPRAPKTAAEKREARIAALRAALAKETHD